MRRCGRQKLYQTNAAALRPLHEWTAMFEKYWQHQLVRVKQRAEAKVAAAREHQEKSEKHS
jgi:hypothetical protein